MSRFYCLIFLVLFSTQLAIAQHNGPKELPEENGKIVFHFNQVTPSLKNKAVYSSVLEWIKNDTIIKLKKANTHDLHIDGSGILLLSTSFHRNPLEFKANFDVHKDTLSYRFYGFYLTEIGITLEELLAKNETTTKEDVLQNLWLITADLESKINEISYSLKASLLTKND